MSKRKKKMLENKVYIIINVKYKILIIFKFNFIDNITN